MNLLEPIQATASYGISFRKVVLADTELIEFTVDLSLPNEFGIASSTR
jgi:hypothetical protein